MTTVLLFLRMRVPLSWLTFDSGKGEMLVEVKNAYPDLPPDSLILQDYYAGNAPIPGMKIVHWDYERRASQLVVGALNYSLTHMYLSTIYRVSTLWS